jgi:hypothetical protein
MDGVRYSKMSLDPADTMKSAFLKKSVAASSPRVSSTLALVFSK